MRPHRTISPLFDEVIKENEQLLAFAQRIKEKGVGGRISAQVVLEILDAEYPDVPDENKRFAMSRLFGKRISNGDLITMRRKMRKVTVFDNTPCLKLDLTHPGPNVHITCDRCGKQDTQKIKRLGESPTLFLQHWRREKWKIKGDGRRAVCPECQTNKPVTAPQPVVMTDALRRQAKQAEEDARRLAEAQRLEEARQKEEARRLETQEARQEEAPRLEAQEARQEEVPPQEEAQTDMSRKIVDTFTESFKRNVVRTISAASGKQRIALMGKFSISKTSYYEWAKRYPEEVQAPAVERKPAKAKKKRSRKKFSETFKKRLVNKISQLPKSQRIAAIRESGVDISSYYRWHNRFLGDEGKIHKPAKVVDVAQQFKLFQLLQENFDSSKHCYINNYSDARCAEELKLDLDYVSRIREQTVGPLVDAQRDAVLKKIEEINEKFEKEHQTILEMAAELKKTQKAEIDKLRKKL